MLKTDYYSSKSKTEELNTELLVLGTIMHAHI